MKLRRNVTRSLVFVAIGLLGACDKPASGTRSERERVVTLTQENFQTEVLSSPKPVLVDFWAAWCGPCRMIAPTVADVADEYAGKVKVGKVNVDEESSLARDYKISGIPALLIFKDRKVVDRIVGVVSKSDLKAALDKYVGAGDAKAAASEK